MKRTILCAALAVALYSCQSNKSVLSNEYIQGSTFSGVLPCQDCDGIKQVVVLDTGNRFRLSEVYMGNEKPAVEKNGSWAVQDGKIVLYNGTQTIAEYAFAGSSLVSLDAAHVAPASRKQTRQTMLERKNFMRSKKINPDYLEGIDIVGQGNNPGWRLEIHHKKYIQFTLPGLPPIVVDAAIPQVYGDSVMYQLAANGRDLQILLTPGFCSDNASGTLYDYTVHVQYDGQTYQGCGAIVNADGTLTGTWLLQGIEGSGEQWQDQPFIVVDLSAEKFYGNTGCNDISGSARLAGARICFSDINYNSQQECTGFDENSFIDALIKCNGYTIEEGILQMTKDGVPVMRFQRYTED